jgi:hypothetical protein
MTNDTPGDYAWSLAPIEVRGAQISIRRGVAFERVARVHEVSAAALRADLLMLELADIASDFRERFGCER